VRLSAGQPDYLLWLRKEQLQTVTWAGDPTKPVLSNDPLTLSPRRSFAAWSEIVRGTALPWNSSDLAMAGALGHALIDIIAQVNAVRLLIAEHQLAQVRATIAASKEAVAVAGAPDGPCHVNDALLALAGRSRASSPASLRSTADLAALFADRDAALRMMAFVRDERRPWRGELALALPDGGSRMVRVRAEPVPARDGELLGFILMLDDLTQTRQAREARLHLEAALASAARRLAAAGSGERDDVVAAIIANASLAAMDIADGGAAGSAVTLLQEVEGAATLATTLYQRLRRFASDEL
jgi:PAS domain-containing protein